MTPAPRLLERLLHREEATHTSRAAIHSSGSENISPPGLRCCKPSGFCGDAWVCEFQSAHHSVNACAVSSRSFGGAARFSVFQLWIQEGAAQSALTESCPRPVFRSLLHVGDVVVWRQDTARTRVQVVEPLVGDACVARVFDSCDLLRSSFGRVVCSSDA